MNYNSFLTRDYKSRIGAKPAQSRKWMGWHTILALLSILSISALLVLVSQDASASRSDADDNTPLPTQQQPIVSRAQITVPIPIPEPHARIEQNNQPPLEKPQQWSTFKVSKGDSLSYLFNKHDIPASDLHQIMQLGKSVQTLRSIKPGQQFKVCKNQENQLSELVYDIDQLTSLHITRNKDGFQANLTNRTVDTRSTFTSGVIKSSLFEAGKSADMDDALIMQLVGIFGWDIDFALDIRKGDHFSLLYEEQFLEGEKIGDGPIVAAEFTNQGKTYRAVRYTNQQGLTDYYSDDGRSMRKAFLRTPVDFRRISSRFGNRHHPTLNRIKLHKGVDYAASTGTPIKAAGDGKVIFRGNKGGYGRVVIIQHGGKYSTLYAHMSRFQRGVYAGQRVRQGQTIGYVGASGRATGPHLHYEFRVNGVHRNPLTVKLPDAAPIPKQFKDDFIAESQQLFAQLDAQKSTRVALKN